ncbi:MAG: sigma-70 family RNA polymerase sigma factor [Symploca sp. SIO1C4]|uniref:Sigma-70 family RNA polymerase sigma factor n=1 Tax=Symploca sp. SIO1C4 TaxID=2607765 RepID=A0A6B3NE27_9CYAN|nr:sigma-70 family RNA polymerase sigma factor [Symploca sp. SIO1C4]
MTSCTANTRGNLIENAATQNARSHLISGFWQQWQESRGQLYRCCLKMMNFNPMDAEDALSQAMVKAWEKVQKFWEKITNLKAWLYQVTRNFCIDLIRKRSCGAVGIESIEWVGNTEEVITTGTVECPESVLEREERSAEIRGAIAKLPEKCRETFILHFYRELSYKEIAEQQGISYDNVCKRISLARKQLKEKLSAYFRESESEVGANSHLSLQISVESQSPTPEENGEQQQQIRSQDEKNVLETETVSVESEIAKVQPFPKKNAIFSCHSINPSGDRSISPSQPQVEKSETVDSSGELDRVRIISDEKTDLRYTGQISLFSPFPAPLFISIEPEIRLKAIVGLNITDVVNVTRDPPLLSILSVFWQSLMQGVGWKGCVGAIARYWNSCARGLFDFYQELLYPEFIARNSWRTYIVDTVCVFPGFDTG